MLEKIENVQSPLPGEDLCNSACSVMTSPLPDYCSLPSPLLGAIPVALVLISVLWLPYAPFLSKALAPFDVLTDGVNALCHAAIDVLSSGVFTSTVTGSLRVNENGGVHACFYFLWLRLACLVFVASSCALLAFGRWAKASRATVLAIGALYGIANLAFVMQAWFCASVITGFLSLFCGLVACISVAYVGLRPNLLYVKVVLLSIGVQCAIYAFDSVRCLLPLPRACTTVVAASHASNNQRLWLQHAEIAHWGRLACAVAVSHVLTDAGVLAVDELNVDGLVERLTAAGWLKLPFNDRHPGDVIIAFDSNKGAHTGIVSESRDLSFANHSSNGRWMQDSADFWTGGDGWEELYVMRPPCSEQ